MTGTSAGEREGSRSRPAILFAGAASVDLIFQIAKFPAEPGKVLARQFRQVAHGMATSAATAAARLGARAVLVARIGDDAMGDAFLAEIEAEGVDCRLVQRVVGAATPRSAVIVDEGGERLIVPHYDANLASGTRFVEPSILDGISAVQTDVRWPEAAAPLLDMAKSRELIALLDADTGPAEATLDLAKRASHVVFSEPAALSLAARDTIPEAVRFFAERLPGFVAVTGGPAGCFWMDGGVVLQQPAPPVAAVDTLAAGDVFHGAFTLALCEGRGLREAAVFANAAAAISCTIFGGRLGAPDRAAVEAMIAGGVPELRTHG